MEEKQFYIVHLETKKYYADINGKIVDYVDDKEDAKILKESELGAELIKIRLTGELVEFKEV